MPRWANIFIYCDLIQSAIKCWEFNWISADNYSSDYYRSNKITELWGCCSLIRAFTCQLTGWPVEINANTPQFVCLVFSHYFIFQFLFLLLGVFLFYLRCSFSIFSQYAPFFSPKILRDWLLLQTQKTSKATTAKPIAKKI